MEDLVVLSLRPFPQLLVTGCLDFSFKFSGKFWQEKAGAERIQVQRESRGSQMWSKHHSHLSDPFFIKFRYLYRQTQVLATMTISKFTILLFPCSSLTCVF